MSIFRFRNSKVYWMDFFFHGQRIQESTGTRSKTLAKKIQDKRRRSLEEGAAGIRTRTQPQLFSVASAAWLQLKKPTWGGKTFVIAQTSMNHLLPLFGKKLLVDIEARDVARYQKERRAEGAAPRTVNIEVATLRQIMRKHGAWARIQSDVKMLHEREDVGRAITEEEETALLFACGQSRSRSLLPFVSLALDTGSRYNTIRTLQWSSIDFPARCLKFGKDKTPSGTGRVVPLSQRAFHTLKFWAQQFPNRLSEHYVFPSEKVGASGDAFDAKVYNTDPTKPIGDIKEAWEGARKRTRRNCPNCKAGILADKPKPEKGYVCVECRFETPELPAGLVGVRFHDLRHSAVSRMIAAGKPLPIIAKIVGWSAGTMAKMAARYGHFSIDEMRGAVEAISHPAVQNGDFESGSLEFSLESKGGDAGRRAN